jgi:hypothetical protein
MPLEELERWLRSNLNALPEKVTYWRLMVNGSRLAISGWPLAGVPR